MKLVHDASAAASAFRHRLLQTVDQYRDSGAITHPNGTISIGKIPGREKWFLIHLYAGLADDEIRKIESRLDRRLPGQLREFYRQFNGMTLFGAGQVQIWGLRGEARMDMPNYQPISITTGHTDTYAELQHVPDDALFFGGYFGHYFYASSQRGGVFACKQYDGAPVADWPGIYDMLIDICERLSRWFDHTTLPVDKAVNERPVLFS